jgi:hypothetical protein
MRGVPAARGGGTPSVPTPLTQPPRIEKEEDYKALPSGARYVDPAGNIRKKP